MVAEIIGVYASPPLYIMQLCFQRFKEKKQRFCLLLKLFFFVFILQGNSLRTK